MEEERKQKARARLNARRMRNNNLQKPIGIRIPYAASALAVVCLIMFTSAEVYASCSASLSDENTTPKSWQTKLDVEDKHEDVYTLSDGDVEFLGSFLGDETIEKVVANAKTNTDVRWMLDNLNEYETFDAKINKRLFAFAASEPEATGFAREFPTHYPSEVGESCDEVEKQSGVPLLYQWDEKWGYTVYSGSAFGFTGCCPTSLAMVYQGLTGNKDLSPYDMGVLANELGYMTENQGTDARFLLTQAPALGLTCNEIPATAENIVSILSSKALIIANVGPGDFTEGGHFIVLSGLAKDSSVIVNDPYSAAKSKQTWDADVIAEQSKSLFVFQLANAQN